MVGLVVAASIVSDLIVITDGIIAGPDVHVFDTVLSQLRTSSTACSFLQVGSLFHPHCSQGMVPYVDLMQFIANATGGVYMTCAPQVVITTEATGHRLTAFHVLTVFKHSRATQK